VHHLEAHFSGQVPVCGLDVHGFVSPLNLDVFLDYDVEYQFEGLWAQFVALHPAGVGLVGADSQLLRLVGVGEVDFGLFGHEELGLALFFLLNRQPAADLAVVDSESARYTRGCEC
jgi:hypothetical protein